MRTVLHPHAAYVTAPQPQELPETLVPTSTGPGAHNNRTQPPPHGAADPASPSTPLGRGGPSRSQALGQPYPGR